MTIALVFALKAEWAPWRSHHDFTQIAAKPFAVHQATVGRARVRVALSGVGARQPDLLLDALSAEPVEAVVVVGLAGALRAPFRPGDLIVPRVVRAMTSASIIASDPRLVAVASRCGATIVETLLSVDRVAGRVDEKRRLAAHGDAVDMESFHVLDAAQRRGIAGAAVRVVGDAFDEALPLDFDRAVRGDGTISVMNLVGQGLRAPWRWPALVAFGDRQRRAVAELARFLDRFVDQASAGNVSP